MARPVERQAEAIVDVWYAAIPGVLSPSSHELPPEELHRLDRRLRESDRQRVRAAWTTQRRILAQYLKCAPRDVPLERDPSGRPFLRMGAPILRHSMAHSEDWMMLAVSRSVPVGVDLERIDPSIDADRIAARFFPVDEAAELSSLPKSQRAAAFFRAWTEKEAYLKGTGGGVPSRLRSVHIRAQEGGRAIGDWSLHPVDAPPGHTASLAVRAPSARIRVVEFRERGEA